MLDLNDVGPQPFTINIETATRQNTNFRTALWTGAHLQVTLMSIPVDGEIGLEVHQELDQFLSLESGRGRVQMGSAEDQLTFDQEVQGDWAVLVPAGHWHNITNIGSEPLQLYSIYAPPEHPHGTVHATKADADAAEQH